jgi:hypothetical protein
MNKLELFHLRAGKLKLADIAGLADETLFVVEPQASLLGDTGVKKIAKLRADNTAMKTEIDRPHSSLLTGPIKCDQVLGTLGYLIGSNNGAEVSAFLLDAGIDGIQYPTDYLSDQSDKGTYNYVVFDENVIEITDKIRLMSTSSGEVYGFVTKDGVIYLDPDRMNANTPILRYTSSGICGIPIFKSITNRCGKEG